jgi:hypothetical protein
MKRASILFTVLIAVGCGGKPAPSTGEQQQAGGSTTQPATTAGKPSEAEALASIREYFSNPGSGWSNVEVVAVSVPVEAPKEAAPGVSELWAYSVTMTCDNVIGEKMLNKNCLILIGREYGKPSVKDYFNSLERVAASPLGKDWWAKSGLPEPVVE